MSKVNIVNVSRNIFKDKDGREVSYCKFNCLVAAPDSENSCGFELVSYTTKYDNYDLIKNCVKAGKSVELEVDFVRQRDGKYKPKPTFIDGSNLV